LTTPHRHVVTVRGPVAPDALGVTLSHDHVLSDAFAMYGEASADYSWILDEEDVAIRELEAFAEAGGGAIVDPTNVGLGRQPLALRRISEAADVHIVMGAGWYREKVYPPEVDELGPDGLADELVRELVEGVGDTGIRAGFVGEIGTGRGSIRPAEERVFRAAARAHRATGCAIVTHTTHFGELALEQLALLADEGVPASSVIVSHLGDRTGIASIVPIAERGAWLGVDNLGFVGGYAPLQVRVDNIAALWSAGFGEQILLGNDVCRRDQLATYGGIGYANVIQNVVPLLAARGLDATQIATMTTANPARAFAYDARAARQRWLAERATTVDGRRRASGPA
jgi:predicted metal-dependent phosphotriesterase family hydrolase